MFASVWEWERNAGDFSLDMNIGSQLSPSILLPFLIEITEIANSPFNSPHPLNYDLTNLGRACGGRKAVARSLPEGDVSTGEGLTIQPVLNLPLIPSQYVSPCLL